MDLRDQSSQVTTADICDFLDELSFPLSDQIPTRIAKAMQVDGHPRTGNITRLRIRPNRKDQNRRIRVNRARIDFRTSIKRRSRRTEQKTSHHECDLDLDHDHQEPPMEIRLRENDRSDLLIRTDTIDCTLIKALIKQITKQTTSQYFISASKFLPLPLRCYSKFPRLINGPSYSQHS